MNEILRALFLSSFLLTVYTVGVEVTTNPRSVELAAAELKVVEIPVSAAAAATLPNVVTSAVMMTLPATMVSDTISSLTPAAVAISVLSLL